MRSVSDAAGPSGHTYLDFNAPLSDARAAELVAGLGPLAGRHAVDLGCGWAELLLRLLATEPTATGVGVDEDAEAVDRGIANATARGLADRVRLVTADVTAWTGDPADVLISVGAPHAWGGTEPALSALRSHVRPGGLLLFGDSYWERPPSEATLAGLGAAPDEIGSLPDLVDLALARGFRLLGLSVASLDEWDRFESRWCAGRERWMLDHPGDPRVDECRQVVDRHRTGWLRGYRGELGFAYLTLALPR